MFKKFFDDFRHVCAGFGHFHPHYPFHSIPTRASSSQQAPPTTCMSFHFSIVVCDPLSLISIAGMSLDGVIYWSMDNLLVAALWKIQLPLPQQPLTASGTSGRGEPL